MDYENQTNMGPPMIFLFNIWSEDHHGAKLWCCLAADRYGGTEEDDWFSVLENDPLYEKLVAVAGLLEPDWGGPHRKRYSITYEEFVGIRGES